MQLVDSHCHLDLLDLSAEQGELKNIFTRAHELDVKHFLCVCVRLDDFNQMLAITKRYENVDASVGLHPNETDVSHEPDAKELVMLARDDKVVAIGETGLDYYRSQGDLTWQQTRFREHIRAAREAQKPLIIHTRQARADTLAIMREEGAAEVGGVMHCFTEDWDMAKAAMEMNFYISFSGIVTFRNATDLQSVAKQVPLDRLLIETDSPYLAPMPHRGKPNQPGYVRYVAEFLAELRGIDLGEIAEHTTKNYFNLFSRKGGGIQG